MTRTAAAIAAVLLCAAPATVRADEGEVPVRHGPLQPEAAEKVKAFVVSLAANFGDFYPDTEFRNVRAVWFASGAIIVCGEMNKSAEGARTGWRYFSNSGPLIFESDKTEPLCSDRTYQQPAFSDDTDYAPDFTRTASNGSAFVRTPTDG
jgi:hypothetical protein